MGTSRSISSAILIFIGGSVIVVGAIGSIISGIVVGNSLNNGGLGFGIVIGGIVTSLIQGFLLVAVGEIVENTALINDKLYYYNKSIEQIKKTDQSQVNGNLRFNNVKLQKAPAAVQYSGDVCPSCKAPIPSEAKFCSNCGEWFK